MINNCRIFLTITGLALLLCSPLLNAESVVQEFSGSGGTNTRPFTVQDHWEIQWEAAGSVFQVYLFNGAGEMQGVAANQQGSGTGSSFQPKGGDYYLQVNAIGAWEVRVAQFSASDQDAVVEPTVEHIARFAGRGAKNTRPFVTEGPWEIQWNAGGDIFQIYLHTETGQLVGVAANQQGSGTGTSYQPEAGTYFLKVNALGDWKVAIVPVN